MTTSTPQQQVQRMQQCVQDCSNIVNELQKLAGQAGNNIEIQSSLKEAIHHAEMSIHECNYAMKATP